MLPAILSTVLAVVFLMSAGGKLRRPKSFLLVVLEYQILPPPYARLYARLLPGLELAVGVALLVGLIVGLASLAAAGLLVTFVAGVAINLARGRRIECGCFGGGRQISWSLLLQDLVLLAAALVVLAQTDVLTPVAAWSVLRGTAAPAWAWPVSLIGCLSVVVLTGRSMVTRRSRKAARAPLLHR